MRELLIVLGLLVPDMTPRVAVEAAVTINALPPAPVSEACKCGGTCVNGVITHGDGHRTQCPCPATCKCRSKTTQPCVSGTCALKK